MHDIGSVLSALRFRGDVAYMLNKWFTCATRWPRLYTSSETKYLTLFNYMALKINWITCSKASTLRSKIVSILHDRARCIACVRMRSEKEATAGSVAYRLSVALESVLPGALSPFFALPSHLVSLEKTRASSYCKHAQDFYQCSMYSAECHNSPKDFKSHPSTIPQFLDNLAEKRKPSNDVVHIRFSPALMLCCGTNTTPDIYFQRRQLHSLAIPRQGYNEVGSVSDHQQTVPCPSATMSSFVEPSTVQR